MRFARALDEYPHGSRSRYRLGCRCSDCTGANTLYGRQRALARAKGQANPLIDAGEVRAWLLCLEEKGVTANRVGKLAGVSWVQLYRIKHGQQKHIRRLTAQAVLQVAPTAHDAFALVPAYHSRQLIDGLKVEGWPKHKLAERLGLKSKRFRLHNARITQKHALTIRGFYRWMLGED